ncbi:MAG: quinone oxidoreductase [Geminicoccaceae bacterium]|nr:MAG: quinone oxidoreductase [Geminicoccaceae bacterium]
MVLAIMQDRHGGPEVLQTADVVLSGPAEGEVTIRHTAIGLNFIDCYVRSGLYPLLEPPGTIGMEAAGVIVNQGPGVRGFHEGDRVAYVWNTPGAYVAERNVPVRWVVKLPDNVEEQQAAAMMLKGMTAEYLLHRMTEAGPGDKVLVHAAAGGVGLILTAWAKHKGCVVIGTVSTEAKAEVARAHGADHVVITGGSGDFAEEVMDLTGGHGCKYVYDGIGKDSFEGSLASLAKHGHFVSYGNASGKVPPFDIARLTPRCARISRPSLFPHIATREELDEVSTNLLQAMADDIVKVDINQTYPLAEAARAHEELEGRKTTGQSVLLP